MKWKTQSTIGVDGLPSDDGSEVTIYVTDWGVQVQPSRRAPEKQVYYKVSVWAKSRRLFIDSFEGCFTGAARKQFCDWLAETVAAAGYEIPPVDDFVDSESDSGV